MNQFSTFCNQKLLIGKLEKKRCLTTLVNNNNNMILEIGV
jgi:hypothetical protein